jgi:hypothetical protein
VVSAISVHAASLDYLAAKANAIVFGSVSTRIESGDEVSFTVDVARVLSGNVTGSTVKVVHPWTAMFGGPPVTVVWPLSGIWFLTRGATSGTWDVLPARWGLPGSVSGLFLPALPTPPTGPYAYGSGAPVMDALVNEMAAGFLSATNQDRDPRFLLSAFYLVDTASVRNVLTNLAASGDLKLQTIALTGSLERSIPGAVPTLAALLPSLHNNPDEALVVSALRDSWRDPTPASIRQLVSFVGGVPADSGIRAAAVRALAAIHTKETLPFLASLLSSTDANEQVLAVNGLSSFANSCPMQTFGSMDYLHCDAPGRYTTTQTTANFAFPAVSADRLAPLVSFWQAWWNDHPELH